ncbi:uncharacterized protein DUF3823 [Anseongella ginsenosidimutans]|uniref:Uncharacterized protein DUF3823 n=1 Tax=Anseongella ginsenosidimutans TaxID=496056 RepID=A0A4R3KXB6_9SPHI|nr:DUF3823 domain-containing protein [Anseongella ginsenosidimutans]QEC51243.1 DUF3823 domain-containing protein [Anseongella ginsenosidimutans]TCS90078.1 uncharacterized protein DUF3823 [Anseongella ginsenosidimutans]
MKRFILATLGLSLLVAGGCGLDNYAEPKSKLLGQITYNGEPLGLRGTGEAVQLQLYQDGYELRAPIPVYVAQDGSFEATLFDGQYKLVTRDNNGPWVNDRDTTVVNVSGSTEVALEVTPYFTLSDVSLSLDGESLNATFTVNEVVENATIEYAMVLLSNTSFVDDITYSAREDLRDVTVGSAMEISVDLSENEGFKAGKPLFARVGLRTVGADQAIYSQVVRLR